MRLLPLLPPLLLAVALLSSAWTAPPIDAPRSSADTTYNDPGYSRDTVGFYPTGDTTYAATAQVGDWTWKTLEGMACRDGSPTGYAIRTAPATATQKARRSVLFWLEGGGACFDWTSCYATPVRKGPAEFAEAIASKGDKGIFSDRASNPFAEWNVVYVPYCTGDVHAGNNPNGQVDRHPRQRFVGRNNIDLVLDDLEAFVPRMRRFVLAGHSAGGYGTLMNWQHVQARVPLPVDAYSDCAGLPDDTLALSAWTMDEWVAKWGLERPSGCGPECDEPGSLKHWLAAAAASMPANRLAIVGNRYDGIMRGFVGHDEDCQYGCQVDSLSYDDGLFRLREVLPQNVGTFYRTSDDHCISFSTFFEAETDDNVRLTDWLRDAERGDLYHTPSGQ